MADETLYAFTAADIQRLKAMLNDVEGGTIETLHRRRKRPMPSWQVVAGFLDSAIAATTGLGTKPKVGTMSVYSFTSTGLEDTGIDVTVYNFAMQIATTDRWAIAERDAFTMKLVLTTQFCS